MKQYRLPWIRNRRRSDPDLPMKAPVQLGAVSNGEVFRPQTAVQRKTEELILQKADEGARRLGIDRREFLASSMGMATTLWAMNVASGCGSEDGMRPPGMPSTPGPSSGGGDSGFVGGMLDGSPGTGGGGGGDAGAGMGMQRFDAGSVMPQPDSGLKPGDGGYFDVPTDPTDPDKVCAKMLDASKEFIFDIQTHHVNRANALYTNFLNDQLQFTQYCGPMALSEIKCFDRNEYARLMFLESDTAVAVLSGLPAVDDANNPITNSEIAETRDIINGFAEGTQRLINHHMVLPNQMGVTPDAVKAQLDAMARTKDVYKSIGAWKCYPAWSPNNTETNAQDGWFLDDPNTGRKFIEKGLELGVPVFCIHKGLPIPAFSTRYNDPRDIGVVAKAYPKASFVVYHSAYGHQNALYTEGPYQAGSRVGVNALITSLMENNIGTGSNVYAELGTTWQLVTTTLSWGSLDGAAHVIGKLLKYVGEDNVVWGTDSVWYGSPQSQIESFLQFQISPQFQQQFGYPALTMELKRKILGLNSAKIYGLDVKAVRCAVDKGKLALQKRALDGELGGRRWAFLQPPLRTRRDFMLFHRQNGFRPG